MAVYKHLRRGSHPRAQMTFFRSGTAVPDHSPAIRIARIAAVALIATAGSCVSLQEERFSVLQQGGHIVEAPLREGSLTRHVVIVSIDGLRPDAIDRFGATTIRSLMNQGSYSLTASTILPSKTLPSHASMLTGVEPSVHGITWNSDETKERGHVGVPTIFGIAGENGLETAAFFSKTKFRHLQPAGTIDHAWTPRTDLLGPAPSSKLLGEIRQHLAIRSPNLMFVHLAQPDFAGHTFGWMGRAYAHAVRQADGAVAELIEILDARLGKHGYTLILTSDHGGHARNHGTDDPRDTTIPWLAWGRGVSPGSSIASIRTTDTGATALWLLGVDVPASWTGMPVTAAFSGGRQSASYSP
jgi:arylsulfatase A-like enzyme